MQIRRSHPDNAASSADSPLQRPAWRLFDLVRNATSTMLKRAAIAVAVAWVPLAILAATQGRAALMSFLTDFSNQSRFLLIIPILILGVPPLHSRYELVVHHFGTTLVADDQQARFQSNWRSHERLK